MLRYLFIVLLFVSSPAYADCVQNKPFVVLSPEYQRASNPGCPLDVYLQVTNMDSTECEPRTFILSVGVGEGSGRAAVADPYQTLTPGATTTIEAEVTASEPTYGYLIGSATKPRTRFHRDVTTYAPTTAAYNFVAGCGCDSTGYEN